MFTVLQCDNPFWRFSLAVYAQPSVAAECLALQDSMNIDVNCLLFCAWLGVAKSIVLTEENFAAVDDHVRRWHDTIVRPLRSVRRTMKVMPEMGDVGVQTLRKDIAAIELRAEQIEQALLFELAEQLALKATNSTVDAAVTANVTAFVQRNATSAPEISSAPLLIATAVAYRTPTDTKTLEN